MTARNNEDGFVKPLWSFWEVLTNLLTIVNIDEKEDAQGNFTNLISNSSLLLSKLVEELVAHSAGIYVSLCQFIYDAFFLHYEMYVAIILYFSLSWRV